MGHKWIIDVLADLKSFAQANDLVALADQLEQTTSVASVEISSISQEVMRADEKHIRQVHLQLETSERA